MKNVAESVLARLLNIARANGLVYNELLMRYILERIFYRVGKSRHSGKFILKGGNLFVFWQGGHVRVYVVAVLLDANRSFGKHVCL